LLFVPPIVQENENTANICSHVPAAPPYPLCVQEWVGRVRQSSFLKTATLHLKGVERAPSSAYWPDSFAGHGRERVDVSEDPVKIRV
jgi:hypothetical protein